MCGPLAIAATAGAGIMQAYGAVQQGNAQSAAYSYSAYVAEQNRQTALKNAMRLQDAASQEETALGRRQSQFAGTQLANLAASGVDITSGSAARVIDDTSRLGQEDALTLRRNNQDRIESGYNDVRNFANEGVMAKASAKNARTAGYINAASSLLSTASSVSGKWDAYRRNTAS